MKKQTIKTIGFISSALHIGLTVTGNTVKATTDLLSHQVAQSEGFLVEKIDPSRDRAEVALLREEATKKALAEAARRIKERKDMILNAGKKPATKMPKKRARKAPKPNPIAV